MSMFNLVRRNCRKLFTKANKQVKFDVRPVADNLEPRLLRTCAPITPPVPQCGVIQVNDFGFKVVIPTNINSIRNSAVFGTMTKCGSKGWNIKSSCHGTKASFHASFHGSNGVHGSIHASQHGGKFSYHASFNGGSKGSKLHVSYKASQCNQVGYKVSHQSQGSKGSKGSVHASYHGSKGSIHASYKNSHASRCGVTHASYHASVNNCQVNVHGSQGNVQVSSHGNQASFQLQGSKQCQQQGSKQQASKQQASKQQASKQVCQQQGSKQQGSKQVCQTQGSKQAQQQGSKQQGSNCPGSQNNKPCQTNQNCNDPHDQLYSSNLSFQCQLFVPC